MDTESKNKLFQPKPMADLLPELSGILSRDYIQTLTAKKQPPRTTMALSRTTEKNFKPLTIAEMRADILALKGPSPRRYAQAATSTKKKAWNSSVKLENKTKSHTADGQLKHSSVRKVLQFQTKPNAIPVPRLTVNPPTPKFPKPEFRPKKTLHLQTKTTVRISGIYNMPESPAVNNKILQNRKTLANKENLAPRPSMKSKPVVTPLVSKKFRTPPVPDTPLANLSWKSGSDTSFLQKEKEIQNFENKTKLLAEEPTLENIAEVSPPASTPFKEYRGVQEFFNQSNEIGNSALYNDNTIMSFDNISVCKEEQQDNSKREESVIVSLCDMLNKASVTNVDRVKAEPNDLLEVKKQLEYNIKMIENGIKTLTNIKRSHLKSLQYIEKLKNENNAQKSTDNENNNVIVKAKSMPKLVKDCTLNEISPVSSKPCSVIKVKSPSYKIPKKISCLRKKLLYKSMPNVSEGMCTPNKDMDKRAFNMYMGMKQKEQMNFLNTPRSAHQRSEVPDTPAVTSHNLQMQLDKIYKDT